jgi:integrase
LSDNRDLKLWLEYAGDIPLHQITTALLQDYFVWLRTDYKPRRITGNAQALAPKTMYNFYISLCAFFTWGNREFQLPNPIKAVPVPRFEQAQIEPFTKEEVEALLKACEICNEARTTDRRKSRRVSYQPIAIDSVKASSSASQPMMVLCRALAGDLPVSRIQMDSPSARPAGAQV